MRKFVQPAFAGAGVGAAEGDGEAALKVAETTGLGIAPGDMPGAPTAGDVTAPGTPGGGGTTGCAGVVPAVGGGGGGGF